MTVTFTLRAPRRASDRRRPRRPPAPRPLALVREPRYHAAVAPPPVVTLVTDFGLRDEFAGVVEGVIVRTAPARAGHARHARHRAHRRAGRHAGAGQAVPYLPLGVHLGVVDPGVGSERRALVSRRPARRCSWGPTTACSCRPRRRSAASSRARTISTRSCSCSPSRRRSTAVTCSRRSPRAWRTASRPTRSARSSTWPTSCAWRSRRSTSRDGVLQATRAAGRPLREHGPQRAARRPGPASGSRSAARSSSRPARAASWPAARARSPTCATATWWSTTTRRAGSASPSTAPALPPPRHRRGRRRRPRAAVSAVTGVAADDPRWLALWNAVRPPLGDLTPEEAAGVARAAARRVASC